MFHTKLVYVISVAVAGIYCCVNPSFETQADRSYVIDPVTKSYDFEKIVCCVNIKVIA